MWVFFVSLEFYNLIVFNDSWQMLRKDNDEMGDKKGIESWIETDEWKKPQYSNIKQK